MDIFEADKIFKNWKQWYWPCHFILHSIFINKIPESFLPYPKDVLEEALNIVAKSYWDEGNKKTSDDIKESICSLLNYTKDEEAFQEASKTFSNPELMKYIHLLIRNFQRDWRIWLGRLEKQGGV